MFPKGETPGSIGKVTPGKPGEQNGVVGHPDGFQPELAALLLSLIDRHAQAVEHMTSGLGIIRLANVRPQRIAGLCVDH